jgi:hypothetical protein
MGMTLFYVTVFGFFFCGGLWAGIGDFAGFLKGVWGNVGVWWWFFDGGFVVDRVIIVDRRYHVVRLARIFHLFEIYFCLGCGRAWGGTILGIVRQGTQHLRSLLC